MNPTSIDVIELAYDEWLVVDEPIFFDKTAYQDHWDVLYSINVLHPYISLVHLIKVENQLYKLDGYSRKSAWTNGLFRKPTTILARVIDMSPSEFDQLCDALNQKLLLTLPLREQIQAIYNDLELRFSSERLRSGLIYDALHIALRGKQRVSQDKRSKHEHHDINLKKAIATLQPELVLLDSIHPSIELFVSGVLAGSLIMLGLYPDSLAFFDALNFGHGAVRDQTTKDPVTALTDGIHQLKTSHRTMQTKMNIDLCRMTVHAVSAWLKGDNDRNYWRTRKLVGVDHMPFVWKMKRQKGIHADLEL